MKRAFVSFDQSRAIDVDDDAKTKFIYQTRLNEYLELQKEYVSRKRKLQAAKAKKEKILAQVRFLRQKRKCLLKSQAPNIEKMSLRLPRSDMGRNQSASEVAPKKLQQVLVSNSHLKTGEEEEEEEEGNTHHNDVKFKQKIKKPLVGNKVVGKRKMCLPDQVTLKV
ncbi:hypothetical protein ACS0TY_012228 [Phlomoides rotata]